MAYRVAATTLWISMFKMQFHRTTLDGHPQVQMELHKLCGPSVVSWSVGLNQQCVGLDG